MMCNPVHASLYLLNKSSTQGSGRLFADTLLGSLLSKSCIPLNEMTTPEHFDRPGSTPASVHAATEQGPNSIELILHQVSY